MTYRAWNRFDGCHFVYESEAPAGSERNTRDAVRAWNRSHRPYFEIGEPCVRDAVEVQRRAA